MVRGGGSGRGFAPDVVETSRRTGEVGIAAAFESRGADSYESDPFGLDLAFHDRVAPLFTFLFERYWRVEAMGLHNVPSDGPILFVSNHSGALPFDGAMIVTALFKHDQRVVRFLYDRFVTSVGPVDTFYRRVGGVPAARENALELLKRNEQVVIFPEGVSGVAKPFSDRYRLRAFSPGFARLALALDVPVVPVAVVGAEEIYPLVGRAEGIGKLFGMPYVPITPFFPILGLLGTLPLPTKWYMKFGKPMRLTVGDDEAKWLRARLEAMKVRRKLQAMVTRLKQRRRSVFFG
jgi:1-acyl-sn-glycerol-3-phosphate acyltransferase